MTAPAEPIARASKERTRFWRAPMLQSLPLRISVVVICFLWTLPTAGLFVSSFRNPQLITQTGWWTALIHPFEQGWTLQNYEQVISANGMGEAFLNSLIVTIPATVIPITIAAFAAYAFAWIPFRGRGILFTIVVALLVVPLQMALIPILQIYSGAGLYGTFIGIWLAHTAFGLPLAIFLLYNFMSQLPRDLFESAVDRRRVRVPDVHPDRAAALDPGARRLRDLPVPVGLERPARGPRLPRARGRRPGHADGAVQPARCLWRRVAPADGGRLPDDDRAAGRVPGAPAGVRARDPGRLRQVVTLARLMIAFAGTELPPSAARRIGEQGVAGVTLFRVHNVVDPPQVRRLTAAIQEARPAGAPPLLVAADQEGGQLVGLGDGTTPFAGAMALGATGDEALAERVAGATARELRALGVNVDYAPVCDVADNPANPALGIRSFGDDPEAVGTARGGDRPRPAGRRRGRDGQALPGRRRRGRGSAPRAAAGAPDERRAGRAGAGPVPGGPGRGRADGHDRPPRAARPGRRPAGQPVRRGPARPAARAAAASTA